MTLNNPNVVIIQSEVGAILSASQQTNEVLVQNQTFSKCTLSFRFNALPVRYVNCFFFSCYFESMAKTLKYVPSLEGCVLNQCVIPSVIYKQVQGAYLHDMSLELQCVMNGCIVGSHQADPNVLDQQTSFIDFENIPLNNMDRVDMNAIFEQKKHQELST